MLQKHFHKIRPEHVGPDTLAVKRWWETKPCFCCYVVVAVVVALAKTSCVVVVAVVVVVVLTFLTLAYLNFKCLFKLSGQT